MASAPTSEGRRTRLAEQRRELPDGPASTCSATPTARDLRRQGEVDPQARRVALLEPGTRGADEIGRRDRPDRGAASSHTEAEALLAEQNFIKQYKPRFNIRLRDDKSYPYIAISLDEDFPRVYFTRERHRRDRAYFGPYSNAKRVRDTLEVLGKVFLFRSCEGAGAGPAPRLAVPGLLHQALRGAVRRLRHAARSTATGIDGVIDFLSGRYREIERELERRMRDAAAEQRVRGGRASSATACAPCARCSSASGSPTRRSARSTRSPSRSTGREANAQVFQVRDGVLSDRQSFYLDNAAERGVAEVAEEFILQYYATRDGGPAAGDRAARAGELDERARWPRR